MAICAKIINGSKLDHIGFWSFAQKQICEPMIFLSSIGGPRQGGSVEILRSLKRPSVLELQTKKTLIDPMDHTHQSDPPYLNTNSLAVSNCGCLGGGSEASVSLITFFDAGINLTDYFFVTDRHRDDSSNMLDSSGVSRVLYQALTATEAETEAGQVSVMIFCH